MPIKKAQSGSIAQIRDGWLDPEGADALNPAYVSATSFTVDTDLTDVFTSNRGCRITFQSSGVKYCSAMVSSYSAGTGKTTITTIGDALVAENITDLLVSSSDKRQHKIGARLYKAADQVMSNGVVAKILIDTVDYEVGNNFSIANNRYVAQVTGYYDVFQFVVWIVAANDRTTESRVRRNDGVLYARGRGSWTVDSQDTITTGVDVVYLTAGQYVELWGWQSGSSGDISIDGGISATVLGVWLKHAV